MANVVQLLQKGVVVAMDKLKNKLIQEADEQGHRLTGALEKSIAYEVKIESTKITAVFVAESYGLVLEFGIPSSRIPYRGRTGRGGKSAFIEGLIRFFTLLGRQATEAKKAAFATANVMKREGSPTSGSYKYSRNTRRKNWISTTLNDFLPTVQTTIQDYLGDSIRLDIVGDIEFPNVKIPV